MSFPFRFQLIEDLRIEAHAYGYLSPDISQTNHVRQLRFAQARYIGEVDVRVVPGGLAFCGATHSLPLSISPLPVLDIFRGHLYQP